MTIEVVGEIRVRRWKQRSSAKLEFVGKNRGRRRNWNGTLTLTLPFLTTRTFVGWRVCPSHQLRVRPFERLRYKFHTLAENLSDKMVYLDSRSNFPKLIEHTFSVHLFQKRSLSKVQEFSEVQIIRINQPMNIVRTIPDPLRDLNSILDPFQRLFRYEKGTPYGSYIPVTIFTQVK